MCFGTARECARALGFNLSSVYHLISRAKAGEGRYDVFSEYADTDEQMGE